MIVTAEFHKIEAAEGCRVVILTAPCSPSRNAQSDMPETLCRIAERQIEHFAKRCTCYNQSEEEPARPRRRIARGVT